MYINYVMSVLFFEELIFLTETFKKLQAHPRSNVNLYSPINISL